MKPGSIIIIVALILGVLFALEPMICEAQYGEEICGGIK